MRMTETTETGSAVARSPRAATEITLGFLGALLVSVSLPAAAFQPLDDNALSLIRGETSGSCFTIGIKKCPEAQECDCEAGGGYCWKVVAGNVFFCASVWTGYDHCGKTYDPPLFCQKGWKYQLNTPCVCNEDTFIASGDENSGWASDVYLEGPGCRTQVASAPVIRVVRASW